jgi:hypothetical protein
MSELKKGMITKINSFGLGLWCSMRVQRCHSVPATARAAAAVLS